MAYCLASDVTKEFKSLDTTATDAIITSSKITGWIAQADAYIDGRLGTIYEVPVTAAGPLLILKTISIGIVAQRIARILETKSITPKGDQYIPKDLIKEAKETLKMIIDKEIILSGVDRVTSHSGVASYSGSNEVEREFCLDSEQW